MLSLNVNINANILLPRPFFLQWQYVVCGALYKYCVTHIKRNYYHRWLATACNRSNLLIAYKREGYSVANPRSSRYSSRAPVLQKKNKIMGFLSLSVYCIHRLFYCWLWQGEYCRSRDGVSRAGVGAVLFWEQPVELVHFTMRPGSSLLFP
jgi:hypothetical protein